jgi:uncharacterized protein (TIRG00374 family)
MTKSRLIDLLKLAVALGLLVWLFLRLPDPAALWQQILNANKVLLLLGALCYTAAVALSGLKWGVLLRAAGIQVPATRLLSYQWMAEFFNNFLPAQVGGDVMRGYAVAVDTRRKADATASVLIDRFIGLIIFMLFAALASTAMLVWGKPDGTAFTAEGLIFMRFAAVGSVIFTVALLHRRDRAAEPAGQAALRAAAGAAAFLRAHAAHLEQAGRRVRCLPQPPLGAGN